MSGPTARGRRHRVLLPALAIAAVGLGALAACVAIPAANGPIPPGQAATWPVEPEELPAATGADPQAQVSCGGPAFPAAGLEAATGAEKASGPESDALRATLAQFSSAFPGSSRWTWRLARRDATGATFLAQTETGDATGWVVVEVRADENGWHAGSIGECVLRAVLSPEFGPATWALDPAYGVPGPDTTELHILVWELACSGGSPATGRMSAPLIVYAADTVTLTIGVRPLAGAQTCPGPPGTPAIVRLGGPLGGRSLLDGGHVPPAPPSPAFGG